MPTQENQFGGGDPLETMEALGKCGCIATLMRGPYGWSFSITDHTGQGTNIGGRETPKMAIDLGAERWAQKEKNRLVGVGHGA